MANGKGSKTTYGLLGRNIGYSLSPAMHNAAFKRFGISAAYKLFDIEESDLDSFFRDLVSGAGISGINVTVPYKIVVHDMLKASAKHDIDDSAEFLGAVNTVKVEGPRLAGYNTDGKGFYESLLEDTGFKLKGRNVFILGAGGAGRTICMYLANLGENRPEKIHVYDPEELRLHTLINICKHKVDQDICEPVKKGDIGKKVEGCDLIINATPLGTKEGDPLPIPGDHLKKGMVLYDLVYARETELVTIAREKGLVAVDGLGMLVNQGALAFNIWTGKPLGEVKEVMKEALQEALGRA